jgi:hypothetical protein
MTIKTILKDRQKQHGNYQDRADLTIDLQNSIDSYRHCIDDHLPFYQLDALRMICVKMARIVNGDNNYADHWADIAGYSQLVMDVIQSQSESSPSPSK